MSIYLQLKNFRQQHEMTQTDVAKLLGVTREAYSMYESGKREPSLKVLDILAQYYHVSVDELLGRAPSHLPYEEKLFLDLYRELDERAKQMVLTLMHAETAYLLEKNKG